MWQRTITSNTLRNVVSPTLPEGQQQSKQQSREVEQMKKMSYILALWVLISPALYAQEGSVVGLGGRLAQRASATGFFT